MIFQDYYLKHYYVNNSKIYLLAFLHVANYTFLNGFVKKLFKTILKQKY